ncbi:5032_t:CDS:2, partial [Funneliformis geosporum]
MLCATGCTNITPYNKDVSCCEFWTNAPDLKKDCEIIAKLYEEGLLNITSPINTFWDCFCSSYNANSKGIDVKM